MRIALIGCGAIGSTIAGVIRGKVLEVVVVTVFDENSERAEKLAKLVGAKVAKNIGDVLESNAELVVEAASQVAVRQYGKKILASGKSLMVMSVGALADTRFLKTMIVAAKKSGVKIYVPSGAIGGLDAISSASVGGLEEVELTTSKPAASLGLKDVKKRKVVYRGNAKEAIKLYPANVNVSTSLSLAGLGVERTKVNIIADPKMKRNIHEVSARGNFGRLRVIVENVPSPDNPKTSYLAGLSAIAMLKRIASPVEVGN